MKSGYNIKAKRGSCPNCPHKKLDIRNHVNKKNKFYIEK